MGASLFSTAIIARMIRFICILCLLLAACSQSHPEAPTVVVRTAEIQASRTPTLVNTNPPATTSAPTITLSPTPELSKSSQPKEDSPYEVRIHPDGSLYVGDLISLEVIDRAGDVLAGKSVSVTEKATGRQLVEDEGFFTYGIGARTQATLWWVWDTAGLPEGEHQLVISIEPDGYQRTQNLVLNSPQDLPPGESQARWLQANSECCTVHYISGTAAERDIGRLLEMVDERVGDVSQQLGYELQKPLSFTFFPRVLGHGGFAQEDISIAYLDRNYAGGNHQIVMHHEVVHALDARIGGELRPTIFSEGLAVYLSGGHFKEEPLMQRAAALLEPDAGCLPADMWRYPSPLEVCTLAWYLPLERLMDDFYYEQHEIGYLEAGALVEYMVDSWGWDSFMEFYRDIKIVKRAPAGSTYKDGSHTLAIETALQDHFEISVSELENSFVDVLEVQRLTSEPVMDVQYLVRFYDTVRRYQQLLDPSAFFLSAWLPDNAQMRQKDIVADYVRHPQGEDNLALEVMLLTAEQHLLGDEYQAAGELLDSINAVLGAVERGEQQPFAVDTLALDYLQIVQALISTGYNPHRVSLLGDQAQVVAAHYAADPVVFAMLRTVGGWAFVTEAGN